jgi:hypothetical protein
LLLFFFYRVFACCPKESQAPSYTWNAAPTAFNQAMVRATLIASFGQPEHIARMVLYLASEVASFITALARRAKSPGAIGREGSRYSES